MRSRARQCKNQAIAQRRRLGHYLILMMLVGLCLVPSASASSSDVFFGISSFNQLRSDDEAAEVQRLGIKRMRNNIVWRDFQRSNCNDQIETGVDFSFYDTVVRRAAEHDITIIANLYGTRLGNPIPNQSCPNGADLHEFPVPGTQIYKDFVLEGGFVWQVVKRYGINGSFWGEPKNQDLTPHPIKIWEVWNEPNLGENNPNNSVWPQGYANLLIATSKTIKKAQEEMVGQNPWNVGTRVLFGGLYGDRYGPTKTGKIEIYWHMDRYMDAVYDQPEGYTPAQLHAAFDGFSYHPYYIWGNQQDVINTIGGARVVLDQHGDANKEIWLTEIGWPVAFGANVGIPSYSPQQVGDMLNEVLTWTHNNEVYLKAEYAAAFVYEDLSNACGDANCWPAYAGIKEASGKERPAFCRIANLTHNSGNYCEFGPAYLGTGAATNLQPRQATLNGTIDTRGLKTRYRFQWGKTTSYTNENPVPPGGDVGWKGGNQPISVTITQLSPGTTYHYRLIATNAAGTSYGSDRTFTTPGTLVGAVAAGKLYVKHGALNDAWSEQNIPGVNVVDVAVASSTNAAPVVVALGENGRAYAKQGLNSSWSEIAGSAGPVKDVQAAADPKYGAMIGVVFHSESAYVKQGGVLAPWVQVAVSGTTKELSIASDSINGPLVGVRTGSGSALVKKGNLGAPWVTEQATGVKQFSLDTDPQNGAVLGVVMSQGSYARQGEKKWTDTASMTQEMSVATDSVNGPMIGVKTDTGSALVKRGDLFAGWSEEFFGGFKGLRVMSNPFNGPVVGIHTTDDHAFVKEGDLTGPWADMLGGITVFAIAN